jgi:histidine triad (HIT) family protein
MLVMPKVEVDYIFDLPDGIYAALWQHCKMLAGILRTITGAARVGIVVEGFSVPHVHVHLCPVNAVAELDPHREIVWTETERDGFAAQFREKLAALDAR